jgi:hypothetical protein
LSIRRLGHREFPASRSAGRGCSAPGRRARSRSPRRRRNRRRRRRRRSGRPDRRWVAVDHHQNPGIRCSDYEVRYLCPRAPYRNLPTAGRREMHYLRHRCHRLIWLNPPSGATAYGGEVPRSSSVRWCCSPTSAARRRPRRNVPGLDAGRSASARLFPDRDEFESDPDADPADLPAPQTLFLRNASRSISPWPWPNNRRPSACQVCRFLPSPGR